MKRLVLFAALGGGIGAGAALARGSDTPTDSGGPQTDVKTAALSGAAAGGFVGFVLDRRAKRKARKTKLVGYAQKARPKVEAALEAAFAAAEIALPRVEAAAEGARERAKHVAAERADIAKRKAKKSGHPRAAKALDLLPV